MASHCLGHHATCRAECPQLPSRFIDVGEDTPLSHVTLRERKELDQLDDGRYVALSHCWGQTPSLRTTRSTLADHKRGIALSELPQSFADAVAIVRLLGVRYLWIDSLCIVQDDEHDWQRESGAMSAIYRDAYLVLAAARGASDAQGFLGTRQQRDVATLASPDAAAAATGLTLQLQPPLGRRWTEEGHD